MGSASAPWNASRTTPTTSSQSQDLHAQHVSEVDRVGVEELAVRTEVRGRSRDRRQEGWPLPEATTRRRRSRRRRAGPNGSLPRRPAGRSVAMHRGASPPAGQASSGRSVPETEARLRSRQRRRYRHRTPRRQRAPPRDDLAARGLETISHVPSVDMWSRTWIRSQKADDVADGALDVDVLVAHEHAPDDLHGLALLGRPVEQGPHDPLPLPGEEPRAESPSPGSCTWNATASLTPACGRSFGAEASRHRRERVTSPSLRRFPGIQAVET